jgi:hypothetical protein
VPLPPFTEAGDLPSGVHTASIREVVGQLAVGTPQRKAVGTRLTRVYELATATGAVDRFFVFGSFVTAKPEPNDVDVFLVMKDSFDLNRSPVRLDCSSSMLPRKPTSAPACSGCGG